MTRPNGRVLAMIWGTAEECESEEAATRGVTEAIAPYRRANGSYLLRNHFHYVTSIPA